ncbi:helix-turn-helix domain-containing protein [Mycobacterium sp. AMU20-3851]|uniref:helix-turn-helix domain-containing protein n=1 Tax=Mycobacterium sp. AMU20-3851 TaxID=3122055 RepID=UPI00375537EF
MRSQHIRGSTSAPTARALDIIELLGRPGGSALRFSDITRELGLTQATAHSILKTLFDRGWVSRDPIDKTYTLGPSLTLVAAHVDGARPVIAAAKAAIRRVSADVGYPASVLERVGDSLVITAFDGGAASVPGDRIPYAPPFGVAFAAWDTAEEQRAWIARAAASDPELTRRLHRVLADTRARGFDIDSTTPALAEAAKLMGGATDLPDSVRHLMDRLLVEFTTIGPLAGGETRPVATISAPVLDRRTRVSLIIAVHPLRTLPTAELQSIGARLVEEAAGVAAGR